MNDLPTVSYSPDTGGRLITEKEEGPTFDLTPRQSAGPLILGGIFLACGLANAFGAMSSSGPAKLSGLKIFNAVGQTLIGCWWLTGHFFARHRAVMHVHAGGFVLEETVWTRRKVRDISWKEVKDVFVASGADQAWIFSQTHWLRIELIDDESRKVVPLSLMKGYQPKDIEAVADELDRWRQNAAATPVPVR